MFLEHGKVYRFKYTDQRLRDRGLRTALLVDEQDAHWSTASRKFLDLDKGEYRNFVPNRMSNIQPVTCDVGYVNVGKLSPDLYSGILKTWEGAGYTVFRDGDHVNAVKGWERKKPAVTIQPLTGGVGFIVDGFPALYIYRHENQVAVWNQGKAAYDFFTDGQYLEALKAIRDKANVAILKAEA